VSEASVYRLLKAHDLIASPAFIVMKAADRNGPFPQYGKAYRSSPELLAGRYLNARLNSSKPVNWVMPGNRLRQYSQPHLASMGTEGVTLPGRTSAVGPGDPVGGPPHDRRQVPVLMRRRIGLELSNNDIAGFKFATVGVIYAVLLAFGRWLVVLACAANRSSLPGA
jgi:hypothetical protein